MTDPDTDSYQTVRHEISGAVAVVRIDDGKANAISHAVIDGLNAALDAAERQAGAVVIIGREGKFSAGFDLSVIKQGPDAAVGLLKAGAALALRIYEHPQPVVMGCTGHALAMGAILLMAADIRIGSTGPAKIGLNEVSIGMPVPLFATELARDRLSKRHLTRSVNLATIYTPNEALDVGFLDEVVEPEAVAARATSEAARLAELNGDAFAATRVLLRGKRAAEIRAEMDADLERFTIST